MVYSLFFLHFWYCWITNSLWYKQLNELPHHSWDHLFQTQACSNMKANMEKYFVNSRPIRFHLPETSKPMRRRCHRSKASLQYGSYMNWVISWSSQENGQGWVPIHGCYSCTVRKSSQPIWVSLYLIHIKMRRNIKELPVLKN